MAWVSDAAAPVATPQTASAPASVAGPGAGRRQRGGRHRGESAANQPRPAEPIGEHEHERIDEELDQARHQEHDRGHRGMR
jgi:hypothetical protein